MNPNRRRRYAALDSVEHWMNDRCHFDEDTRKRLLGNLYKLLWLLEDEWRPRGWYRQQHEYVRWIAYHVNQFPSLEHRATTKLFLVRNYFGPCIFCEGKPRCLLWSWRFRGNSK
jgi:hypothetical protein